MTSYVNPTGLYVSFYLLYNSIMTEFKNWQKVISVSNKWQSIEAVVDFEKDWKVYISEWWKTLANPVRFVVDKDMLTVKENWKIKLTLNEMNELMVSMLNMIWQEYDKEPDFTNLKVWDVFQYDWRKYKYSGKTWDELVRQYDWYYCTIDKADLPKLLWSRNSVCQQLFWVDKSEVIVTDENWNEF